MDQYQHPLFTPFYGDTLSPLMPSDTFNLLVGSSMGYTVPAQNETVTSVGDMGSPAVVDFSSTIVASSAPIFCSSMGPIDYESHMVTLPPAVKTVRTLVSQPTPSPSQPTTTLTPIPTSTSSPPSSPLPFTNSSHACSSLSAISEMRRQLIALDLSLGFDDGSVLRCHRVVLAAASVFFRSFFSGVNSSVPATSAAPKIQIRNATAAVFDKLLDYAYTGRIEITREELPQISDAARTFGFKEVESICHLASEKFRYRDKQNEELSLSSVVSVVDVVKEPKEPKGNSNKPPIIKTPLYRRRSSGKINQNAAKSDRKSFSSSKLTNSEEDVEFVKALAIVLCDFERKLPPRAAATMRKWKKEPEAKKEIACALCDDFVIGAFDAYIQHVWEKRQVHDANESRISSNDAEGRLDENEADVASTSGSDSAKMLDEDTLSKQCLGLFKCLFCDQMFVSKELREAHARELHPPQNYPVDSKKKDRTCSICDKTFRNGYTMKKHFAHVHKGLRGSKKSCPECGKMYSGSGLRAHRAREHDGVRKSCSDCPDDGSGSNVFTDAAALWTHRQRCHSTKKFRCAVCLKDFSLKRSWKTHYEVFHGGKRWKCSACGKSFFSNHALKQHNLQIHQQITHDCPECGKKFSQASKLKLHTREHNGDFSFVCSLCGKGFMSKTLYRKHLINQHQRGNVVDQGVLVVTGDLLPSI